MFSPETYIQRRNDLAKKVGSGVILLLGNEDSSMNYKANVYPFRQDSSFLYFFGLNIQNLAAVIDIDEDRAIIFGDDPGIEDIVWMGPQVTLKEKADKAGVVHTAPYSDLDKFISEATSKGRLVHFLPPYRPENMLKIESLLEIPAMEAAGLASIELIKSVASFRSVKSEEEIVEIEKSIATSFEMHTEVMKSARAGMKESALFGLSEGIAIAHGGRPSFPIILTVHGETLHNPFHENILQDGQLVLHDSGAEGLMNYCSDITRTFPVSGKFDSRQKEIYEIALKAQQTAIDAIKPEIPFRDIHLLSCKVLAEGMKSIGVMKGDIDEAVHQGAHAIIFQCGLGHMMGLDVHDMENLGEEYVGYNETVARSSQFGTDHLRLAKPLDKGYVVTVEPGVYFIPELIDRWKSENKFTDFIDYKQLEKWRTFGGVRIEDDVLVTKSGARVLGKPIPKTVAEIESLTSK